MVGISAEDLCMGSTDGAEWVSRKLKIPGKAPWESGECPFYLPSEAEISGGKVTRSPPRLHHSPLVILLLESTSTILSARTGALIPLQITLVSPYICPESTQSRPLQQIPQQKSSIRKHNYLSNMTTTKTFWTLQHLRLSSMIDLGSGVDCKVERG